MTKKIKTIGFILFVIIGQLTFGQTSKEIALSKGQEAIKLMDEGKIDESIKLLKEAQKLDPERVDYPYELAYAYYLKEDYKGAIKILEKYLDNKDVSELFFQLLGNSYDILGKLKKLLTHMTQVLKNFPIQA